MVEHKLQDGYTPDRKKRPGRYVFCTLIALGGLALASSGEVSLGLFIFGGSLVYAYFS